MAELKARTIEELLQRRGIAQPAATAPSSTDPVSITAPSISGVEAPSSGIEALFRKRNLDLQSMRAKREKLLGDIGVFQRKEDIKGLKERGVDVTTGASAGARARLALTPPERQDTFLQEEFPLGFERTNAGIVVNIEADAFGGVSKQVLLDEEGFSLADFADASAEGLIVGGSLLGAVGAMVALPVLATGGVISLAALAVITGVSGQSALGVAEVINSLRSGGIDLDNPEDVQLLKNIASRRGIGAAIDSVLDFISAGAFRVGKALRQKAVAPNLTTLSETPMKETLEAADRLGVTLSTGEKVGGGILRAETISEKLPGVGGPVKAVRAETTEQLQRVEDQLVGTGPPPGAVGEQIVGELTTRRERALDAINTLRIRAGKKIEQKLAQFQAKMSKRTLSMQEAGEAVRTRIQQKLASFKGNQSKLETDFDDLVLALPEGGDSFLRTGSLQITAKELRAEFPRNEIIEEVPTGILDQFGRELTEETVSTKAIPELFPAAARNTLDGILELPATITVKEARNIRQTISAMIDGASAFPGVSVGMLKKLEVSLTEIIRAGVDNAPTRKIGKALEKSLDHFKDGIGAFRTKEVAKALLDETRPGFIDGAKVLPALILSNSIEAAKRVVGVAGLSSAEVKIAKRSVFDEMIRKSQDLLLKDGMINPTLLARQLDRLSPDTRAFLFGRDAKLIGRTIRQLAARHSVIDIQDILKAPGDRTIVSLLRQAARKETQAQIDFDTNILKPFLAGKTGSGAPSPEQFVRFALKKGTQGEIEQLFKLLNPKQRADFQSATTVHILERASATAAGPEAQALALLSGKGASGTKLLQVMEGEFGDGVQESLAKLRSILPSDTIRILEDFALVQAARGQASATAKAVGGMVAGAVLTRLFDFALATVGLKLVKARLVAEFMQLKPVRKWLGSRIKLKPRSKATTLYQVALPQILRAVTSQVQEGSPEAQALFQFFTQEVPKMLGLVPEVREPKPDVTTENVSRLR